MHGEVITLLTPLQKFKNKGMGGGVKRIMNILIIFSNAFPPSPKNVPENKKGIGTNCNTL